MPVLKIALLLVLWACQYIASTPPTPPVPSDDQTSYQKQGLSFGIAFVQRHCVHGVRAHKICTSLIILLDIAFASNIASIHRLLVPGSSATSAPQHAQSYVSPSFVMGVACALSGMVVRIWSYRTLGVHFTFQLSLLKNHKLVTTGPYAYVRHPSYTALITTFFGVLMCETARGSWWTEARVWHTVLGKGIAVFMSCYTVWLFLVVSRATAEDEMLSKEFGGQWREWQRKVPYQFIPGIL